jgi:hypothetical protein
MKKTLLTTLCGFSMIVSSAAFAQNDSPLSYIADVHGQQALLITKQEIFKELEYNVRNSVAKTFSYVARQTATSDNTVNEYTEHSLFAKQARVDENLTENDS